MVFSEGPRSKIDKIVPKKFPQISWKRLGPKYLEDVGMPLINSLFLEKYLVFLKKGNCPFIIVFENDVDPLVVSFGKNPHSSWGSAMTFRSCCQSLLRKLVKMNQRSSDWLDGYAIIAAMVRHHRKQLQEASRERGEIFHPGRPASIIKSPVMITL